MELRDKIASPIYDRLGGDTDYAIEGGYHPIADLAGELADKIIDLINAEGWKSPEDCTKCVEIARQTYWKVEGNIEILKLDGVASL